MKYSRAALLPSPWAAGLFALLLALPVFARAQDVPGPTPGTPPTVLVMGDSLSAGYGLPTEQGWVALLEDRIRSEEHTSELQSLMLITYAFVCLKTKKEQ